MLEEGFRLGHYRILRPLSSGGMADVYEAMDGNLNRRVALKVLPPEFGRNPRLVARFEREVRASARLNHRNIVTVFEVGFDQSLHFYAMRLLTGGDLRARIDRGMTPREALQTLWELAHAFDHAHRHGFVHRDMKPENVIFDEQGVPVLTDFGIAKVLTRNTHATRPGVAIGTPYYISPEQARGHAVDARTDLYALGTVFFEMLTGNPPYDGEDALVLIFKHASEPIPRLPEALSHLQPLVDGLMAKQPSDRIGSAAALITEINQLLPAEMAADRGSSADPDVVATLNMRTGGLTTREEIERRRRASAAQLPPAEAPVEAVARGTDETRPRSDETLEDEVRWQQRHRRARMQASAGRPRIRRSLRGALGAARQWLPAIRSKFSATPAQWKDLVGNRIDTAVAFVRSRDRRTLVTAALWALVAMVVPLAWLKSGEPSAPREPVLEAAKPVVAPMPIPAEVAAPAPPAPSVAIDAEPAATGDVEEAPIAEPSSPRAAKSQDRKHRNRASTSSAGSGIATGPSAIGSWTDLIPRRIEPAPSPPPDTRIVATALPTSSLAGNWVGEMQWTRSDGSCTQQVNERWHLTLRPDLSGKFRVDSYASSAADCTEPQSHTTRWGGTISPSGGGTTFRLKLSDCVSGDCDVERTWSEYARVGFDSEMDSSPGSDTAVVRVRGQSLKLSRE